MSTVLVIGGSASGKSDFAEALARKSKGPLIYIATMKIWDEECRKRVEKHQARRAGFGFKTIEKPLRLSELCADDIPPDSTCLLECMSNLAANEMYDPEGSGDLAAEEILQGIEKLKGLCNRLIVVSNDVFGGGSSYLGDTLRYLEELARINNTLASRFEEVYEVTAGIARRRK